MPVGSSVRLPPETKREKRKPVLWVPPSSTNDGSHSAPLGWNSRSPDAGWSSGDRLRSRLTHKWWCRWVSMNWSISNWPIALTTTNAGLYLHMCADSGVQAELAGLPKTMGRYYSCGRQRDRGGRYNNSTGYVVVEVGWFVWLGAMYVGRIKKANRNPLFANWAG